VTKEPLRLFILGPTCTGKSNVGAYLAKELRGEVISTDSMQVYGALPVLSAHPTVEQRSVAPHHLIGFVDSKERFDVFAYVRAVLERLETMDTNQTPAVFVGGTWYYFRALVQGFDPLPPGDQTTRAKITEKFGDSPEQLHAALERVDSTSAERLHPNDRRRVIRALEIYEITGKPMSSLIGSKTVGPVEHYRAFWLDMPREKLYEKINARVDEMMRKGALDEVRTLCEGASSTTATVFQALGVNQLRAHIEGNIDLDEAIRLLKRDTRHYARRQISFLRRDKRIQRVNLLDFESSSKVAHHILEAVSAR